MGIFRTLLYAVILYYGWKLLKNMFTINKQQHDEQKDTETNHDNDHSNDRNKDGEYVDYEEIK
ncbi:MAG: DUF4834 family protein [Bacteroidia bacterium]|nr:DUF4834 family protein [Bacteroidia bacterium]